jgi:hypothetical protein
MATIKSAIKEVRDQLFLDTADGQFLSIVTQNIGMVRPNYGFADDDIWRAVVRRLALDTKQVEGVFRELLAAIFGPQNSVSTVLTQNASIGDESIYIDRWMSIPQRGTLILDEGLAAEETVEYSFRDPATGEVTLKTELVNNHTAAAQAADSLLAAPASASDTTIIVRNSYDFPTSGFPYSLLIDAGTDDEEVVQLTGLSTGTGDSLAFSTPTVTLTDAGAAFTTSMIGSKITIAGATSSGNNGTFTVTGVPTSTTISWNNTNGVTEAFTGTWTVRNGLEVSALANNHAGPTVSFVTSGLDSVSSSSGVIFLDDSTNFPAEGYVRIQEDGSAAYENVEYVSNDLATGMMQLVSKLEGSYTDAEVTLLRAGASVSLSQIKVAGAGWDIWETNPRVLTIYLPEALDENRLQDATFLHGPITGASSTTVSGAHSIGDTTLAVASAATFPDEGIILINSVEAIAYTLIRPSAVLYSNDPTGIPIGTTVVYVDNAAVIYAYRDVTKDIVIDLGGTAEYFTWTDIDLVNNTITLDSATTSLHSTGDIVNLDNPGINDLRLSRGLANAYTGGETVAVIENNYSGAASLEDGRIYTLTDHLYQGSYLWSILNRISERNPTSLDENIAGPTYLEVSQKAARTALEVKNAALFNSSNFQEVQIGRGLAGREIRQINDITLMRSVSGVTISSITSASEIVVSGSSGLPEAWGYRLFIDDNGGGPANQEEVVIVKSFTPGTNTLILETPLAGTHSAGDNVQLMADVLTIDALSYDHEGSIYASEIQYLVPLIGTDWSLGTKSVVGQRSDRVAKIEEIRSYIDVADASGFPANGGYAQINFGRNTNFYESQLSADEAAASTSIVVDDGSGFPTSSFFVHIGVGTSIIETVLVASRTGNTLTLTPPASNALLFNHRAGEWVKYFPGEREQVVYTGTETGGANERLLFSRGIYFTQDHLDNEPVAVSSRQAVPVNTGTDYPFYLPSRWQDRIEYLIDLARAAGVKVVITSDR